MTGYADLEIGLHRWDAASYSIELRFSHPESDTEVRLIRGGPVLVRVDFDRLRALAGDGAAYGQLLADGLFADDEVRAAFAQARSAAQTQGVPLRVRLFIGPSAPELHSLHWETLRDPQDGSSLLTGEHLLFSRYLSSLDWRPVRRQPRTDLRALVAIANPRDLSSYAPTGQALAPLDVDGELARAASALGKIPITALAAGGQANLRSIAAHLRDDYDIFYLVCHGALIKGTPHLWLEDEAGTTSVVDGSELVAELRDLQRRPRLVVLASCQSAGGGEGALAALGPRLAEIGIPAVVAMQGDVAIRTVDRFMPVFFQELQRDGQIDRAMAVARGATKDRSDWWAPVLFMRLKSGQLWYTPGFSDEERGLKKWPSLLRHIEKGRCTPIVGPGLAESLLCSRQEIARHWAEKYTFPMAPHNREDLPQVAQYLSVNQDRFFPRDELIEHLRQEIICRHRDHLDADLLQLPLTDLLSVIAAKHRAENPAEPYRVLAELPLPVYITTDFTDLLTDALKAAGKDPRVELCRWNEDVAELPSIYAAEPLYRPDAQHPLVYHMFGRLQEPRSLVLTEDDYFDFLIGVTRNRDTIPAVVRRALVDTALLFLGFQIDDWAFRVLFRSIMSQEGRGRREDYAHIAAQIDLEEGRILEPENARRYLESYFQKAEISIYWGSVEDFAHELLRRWEGRG